MHLAPSLSLTVSRLTAGDTGGEHLVLPSDAVHSIDSEDLCSSDDLTSLNHLNEPNIIHGLGIRFRRSLPIPSTTTAPFSPPPHNRVFQPPPHT